MVTATSSSTSTTPSASTTDAATISGDFNFFLKMLTTQLKNQDPTAPMDVSQMTAQIAQYSAVEQQVKTNKNLEMLLADNRQSQLSTAVSYIGKEVETEGNTGNLIQSQATFSYQLPKAAHTVAVVVKDKAGRAVFQGAGTTKEGSNLVVWDGKNSFNNNQEPDGEYTIVVTAKDAEGKTIQADTRAVGTVASVQHDKDGTITLTVGTVQVPYDQILAVRLPTRVVLPGDGEA
jgi:flagellar basal-body rod modification protein FlgD